MTDVTTINHTTEGIRFHWPDSTSTVFSNPVYLAEAYARAERAKGHARNQLTGRVAEAINQLENILESEAVPLKQIDAVRVAVKDAVHMLT